ncbi:MAG: cysteine desulfurase [Oscillospiraceae bacterium]|nr:cysteine desulfurase [Oscillospiraceae bacterium]
MYFDNAATTAPRAEAVAAALRGMTEVWGNPSSNHPAGRSANAELSAARKSVADALGAKPENIVFTSGGTEADNLAIFGGAQLRSRHGKHLITSLAEHSAVLNAFKRLEKLGYEVTYLEPARTGAVSPDALADALRPDTTLVSLMLVNNETGAVSPAYEYGKLIRAKAPRALFHVDAVQAFGKTPFSVKSLGADLISISAHKIYAVKGAGALYCASGAALPPLLFGGEQEAGARSGTEALPAIMAFGAAAGLAVAELADGMNHAARLRRIVTEKLGEIPRFTVIADGIPHILSISLPGYRSETLMNCLEEAGFCLSRSSACRRGQRSRVLTAMKLPPDVTDGALRVSFGRQNTEAEAELFAETLLEISKKLVHR